MNKPDNTILRALWDDLAAPILAAARPQLSSAALLLAPTLILVESDPARVGVIAFGPDGPVDCGAYDLPHRAGAALAQFFEAGLSGALDAQLRPLVRKLLQEKRAQLVAQLRPDRGEASCFLVVRGDLHPPVFLFALRAEDSEVRH